MNLMDMAEASRQVAEVTKQLGELELTLDERITALQNDHQDSQESIQEVLKALNANVKGIGQAMVTIQNRLEALERWKNTPVNP